ncbi:hypothetical protein SLEP1_g60191 [Rubroshorea leprosula]|uniref:BHLH domain-containing protein n=1 Tax=Rubroshorea leprosula TaxID=152421 RepID=A0AAV5MX77_9ROSI|nr:hypothetical protein SLEP1_g60191 [Rubroshorea leprosula]
MFPLQGYWVNQSQNELIQESGDDSIKSSESKSEKKSKEACKSHKEAERRRRQRINGHLATLRSLLPNTTKTDKASLLAEVVRHVKELRRQVAAIAEKEGGGCCNGNAVSWPFPGECDEVSLSFCNDETRLVKATMCCEDRPGLNRDLTRAIEMVQAKAVRAEMMTVGGRSKSVVLMEWARGGEGDEEEMRALSLKRALRNVVQNRVTDSGLGYKHRTKRARVDGSRKEGDF